MHFEMNAYCIRDLENIESVRMIQTSDLKILHSSDF